MPERQPDEHLKAARLHFAEAGKILLTRPYAEVGSAADKARLLLARAQVEATLSIAVMLADGVKLSQQARQAMSEHAAAMEEFGVEISPFTTALNKLLRKLDELD
jgi:hypothetical protein